MTEEEAKAKWCPFVREVCMKPGAEEAPFVPPHNRASIGKAGYTGARCIASDCMAWRWGEDRVVPATVTEIADHMRERAVGPLDAAGATATRVRTGHCGLAGAPQ